MGKFENNLFRSNLNDAEKGDVNAMLEVAQALRKGIGADVDYGSARKWYRKAEKKGSVDATYELGEMDYYGEGIKAPNSMAAYRKWCKAGKKNHSEALNSIGSLYITGALGKDNYKKAMEYFEKAIKKKNADAMFSASVLLFKGIGTKQNIPRAKKLLKKSMDLGCSDSQYLMAEYLMKGEFFKKDGKKAMQYYFDAANKGNVFALKKIAMFYSTDKLSMKDEKRAVKIWTELALSGDDEAMFMFGCFLMVGYNVEKDVIKGIEWIKKAAERGNENAKKYIENFNGINEKNLSEYMVAEANEAINTNVDK